jgi:phage-related minor tail protein
MSGGAGSSSGNGSGNSNTPSGQPAANGNSSENLEESKKATDLVLDYLRNQEKNPNPELLEQMNWTDNDLRDFLQRWQAMKERAKVGSTEDRKRYEEALESLGLRSRGPRAANSSGQTRRNSGLGENNAVQNIPDEYAEMFHQFKKNLGRSKTDR